MRFGYIRVIAALTAATLACQTAQARERWTPQTARAWYAGQAWPIGSNYVPADAINQLEMWQAATFDPATIDKNWAGPNGST